MKYLIPYTILIFSLFTIEVLALPINYQSFTAKEKSKILWDEKVYPSEYSNLPPIKSLGIFDLVKLMSTEYLTVSFDRVSDELPKARKKILHPFGSLVKIEFVPEKNNVTQSFLSKRQIGLARLSLAGDPALLGSYTPGMAIKFFRSGKPSLNLHVMHNLGGQGDNQNFFKESFSNILPEPPLMLSLLAGAFSKVKTPPNELLIDHIEAVYQVVFKPNHENNIDPNTNLDFREELQSIPINTLLYSVYVRKNKTSKLTYIGSIITRSEFIASKYGDEKLFFQHHK